jgi:hypothetical protein
VKEITRESKAPPLTLSLVTTRKGLEVVQMGEDHDQVAYFVLHVTEEQMAIC